MGVDKIGINRTLVSLKKIARIIARMHETQKLKHKSQLNNLEISSGALVVTVSLIPHFPRSRITKADARIVQARAQNIVIKYIAGMVL